jgi:hypothetical protein
LHTLRLHVLWIPSPHQAHTNGTRFSSLNDRAIDPLSFDQSRSIALSPGPTSELDPEPGSDVDDDVGDEDPQARWSAARRMVNRDTGVRDAFGFDAVRLRSAPLRSFMAAYGFSNGNPSFEVDGDGSRHMNGTGTGTGSESGNGRNGSKNGDGGIGGVDSQRPFTLDHARGMMIREGSKLRVIVIRGVVYTGRWVWDAEKAQARLEVECAGEE